MNDKELELLNEILSTYKYDDPEMVMEDYEFLKTLNDYVVENTHEFNKEPVYLNRVGINNSYKYSYNFFKTINPIYAEYLEKRWNEAFIFCENNLYGVSNTFYDQKCHDTRIKLFVRKNISDSYTIVHELIHDMNLKEATISENDSFYLLCEVFSIAIELLFEDYLKKQNVSEFEKNKKGTFYAIYTNSYIVDFEYYLLDKFFEKDYVCKKDIINYLEKHPKNSALVGYLIDDILDNESLSLDYEQRYIFGIFLASYMHDRIIENPKKIQEFIELNDYLNSLEIYDIFKIIDLDFNHDSESLTPDSYKKLFKSYKNEMKRKNEK